MLFGGEDLVDEGDGLLLVQNIFSKIVNLPLSKGRSKVSLTISCACCLFNAISLTNSFFLRVVLENWFL